MVDGAVVADAFYGGRSADVAAIHPGFPDSENARFSYQLDTTHFINGLHEIRPRVVSNSGQTQRLNKRTFSFQNHSHELVPFGEIEFPDQNAQLFGVCDVTDPVRRYSVVKGWMLDAGLTPDDVGVGYVELLLDGVLIRRTTTDCEHSLVTGTFTNCYGVRRFDIEQQYPTLMDAPNAGFRFVLDVGELIGGDGHTPGQHRLTVRAGDIHDQVAQADTINVSFMCDDFLGNQGSFGAIDGPVVHGVQNGIAVFTGWALDWEGVDLFGGIRVYIDGSFFGLATFGIPRPDIFELYPGFPDSLTAGWSFALNTLLVTSGEHELEIVVRDVTGADTLIGEMWFQVENP
jgi:hypothetical protein